MNRKIIFLDVDGTLVNDYGKIPDSSVEACRLAKERGHILCVATGRQFNVIGKDVMRLGFDAVISAGGARVDVDGATIYSAAFKQPALAHIIAFFEKHDIGCTFERSESLLASRRMMEYFMTEQRRYSDIIKLYFEMENVSEGELLDSYKDVAKVIFSDIGRLTFDDILREFSNECEVFRGSMPFYGSRHGELCPAGVNKGAAVEAVLRHYNIEKQRSFAIGDGDNDRAMFESCGTGIAMGRGDAGLKEIADYITADINSDGVYKALSHYGLI